MGREKRQPVLRPGKESYMHRAAKAVLKTWLQDDYEVRTEAEFDIDGWKFVSDIATFTDGHLQAFYEVTHRHPVDAKKLGRMQHYCFANNLDIFCHEIDASWILSQVGKPESLVKFSFDLSPDKR